MEDYNLIPIEYEWKISEEQLKNWVEGHDIGSEKKDLQQCPGIQYGLKGCFEENDEDEQVLKMTLALYGTSDGRVFIEDFDWDTVEAAIEYLYDQGCDPFSNGLTSAFSLLHFAEKYDIKDLKDEIVMSLVKEKLLPENVVGISNAAITSNSPTLRDFCSDALLIFMRHGIQVDNIDDLDEEFSKDLFKKAFSGKYDFSEKIYAEEIDSW
uniref:Uncharacterized protein n=1 Tax=Panagrolaimus davidi TaxID=227884 RepID=A0A914QFR8_9BILA